jgi:hypothetical protein
VDANLAFGPYRVPKWASSSLLRYPNRACVIACLGSEAAMLLEPGVGETPEATDLVRVELCEPEHRLTHSPTIEVASAARRSAWSSPKVLLSPIIHLLSVAYRSRVVGDRPGPIALTPRTDTGRFLMS